MAGSPGYYVLDSGAGVVPAAGPPIVFVMLAEPPDGQYRFDRNQQAYVPLHNGYYLSDLLMDGDPGLSGPFPEPPLGALPYV